MKGDIKSEWWGDSAQNSFFSRVYYRGDDSLEGHAGPQLDQGQRTERECKALLQLLRARIGHRILDCPSGRGRHSLYLAEHSSKLSVTGVDINQRAVDYANKVAKDRLLENCRFIRADMRDLPFPAKSVDCVLNMFFSFGFFESEEDNQLVLNEFFRVLDCPGVLLIHSDVNPAMIESGTYGDRRIRTLRDGSELAVEEEYCKATKRLIGRWTITDSRGTRTSCPYSVRIYSHNEIHSMLERAGFSDVRTHCFPTNSGGCLETSQEVAYVARKE